MAQKIDIDLVEQINKTTGELESLSVGVSIYNENNPSKIRSLVDSVPESLESLLTKWKNTFFLNIYPLSQRDSKTAIKEDLSQVFDEDDDDDGMSYDVDYYKENTPLNCSESYQNLITELNNWLQSENWSEISYFLIKNLDRSGEVFVTIQTNNDLLKQLPWLEWKIFREYSEAEIAISPSEYERPEGWENKQNTQVRILVILGANDNINLDQDSKLLNEVRKHGAKLEFLEQPTLEKLRARLKEKKGWNIIFYSGHSETNENGQGVLYLNNNDERGITIDDIENELKFAIDKGLYLAIFNSCDGLGIANKLAELRLPQSIVMKESIPDEMAIHFLENFLEFFCHDLPFSVAVRKTRKELEKKYNNPDQYPGGHSLPLIVVNPAIPLPTWKSFLSEYQLPLKLRIPIIIGVILGVLGLPLSIIYEFGFETFLQYAKLYPHLIIYPICFLWAAIWSVYKCFGQIINKKINQFKWGIPIALFISIIFLHVEVTSPNILLFELSPSAESEIIGVPAIQNKLNSIKEIPSEIVDINHIINGDNIIISQPILEEALFNYLKLKDTNKITQSQAIGFHNLMYLGLGYKMTWKGRKNWLSISHWFYAYTFWLIVFTILILFILWVQVQDPRKFFNQVKYFENLVFSQAMIFFWIPFRLYYINEPKNLIFNYNNLQGLQPLDPCAPIALSMLFLSTVYRIIRQQNKNWILIIITLVLIVSNFILGAQTELLSRIFGLNTVDPRTWIIFVIFTGLSIYIFSNYKSSK
ncbi:MAG: CHAT domain-containing protein [Okeania sp. SIO3B5]|uniref:CHAT domain-containing protein n=1 Tax=Okeania sp. SIO3B5 TaxID=2607811 RepID=UPI0014019294|nr:CHAT domain-containing protein [Okeania sp. SIO3B5]NEO53037.1 CHAT domain-containing protein [Okeania sp. SIO3B5]